MANKLCKCGHKLNKHEEWSGCRVKSCNCLMNNLGEDNYEIVKRSECDCGHTSASHGGESGICLVTSCKCCNYKFKAEITSYRRKTGGNTSNVTGYTGITSKSYSAPCRHKPSPVFSFDDLMFYGGSRYTITGTPELDKIQVVLNASGTALNSWDKTSLPPEFQSLNRFITADYHFKELVIDWMDGQGPDVLPGFWQEFIQLCKDQGFKHIMCICFGGHGRTGTALASIMLASGYWNLKESVEIIHKIYCVEAIETSAQYKYLVELEKAFVPEARREAVNVPVNYGMYIG